MYLSWIRVLKKQEKNRKGVGGVERENWRGYWNFRALGAGVLGCWSAGVLELELAL